jgi:hypothetical protein
LSAQDPTPPKITVEEVYRRTKDLVDAMLEQLPPERREGMAAIFRFRTTLSNETDRGSALMAAAFLDDRLKALIESRLVNDAKIVKRGFDFNGPLGTFSSRIDFAYLLGLIPKNARLDLHKLRAIRNAFAHESGPLDFNDQAISQKCDGLVYLGMGEGYSTGTRFRRTMMRLLTLIEEAIANCKHIDPAPEEPMLFKPLPMDEVRALWETIGGGAYPYGDRHADPG